MINADLNLALPVRVSEDGVPLLWGYHTPIATPVFEANYRIIAATNTAIFGNGGSDQERFIYAAQNGQRIARLTMLDAARELSLEASANALLAEMRRLTFVLAPSEKGFEQLTVDAALARKAIEAEEWSEAEGAILFFTCGYAMARIAQRKRRAALLASVIGGSTTSLPPMGFAASLQTSTEDETSAEPAASLVAS